MDLLDRRFTYDQINQCNIDSQTVLKEDKSKVLDAEKIIKDTLDRITQQRYRSRIMNVGLDAPKLVLSAYQSSSKDARITFGWPYMDNMTGGAVGGDVISFVGRPAAGKAQPLDAQVLTAQGFKRMGDLQIGDELASVDGEPSKEPEIEWFKKFNKEKGEHSGLMFHGSSDVQTRMMALCGALVRNFIDARLVTLGNLVPMKESKEPTVDPLEPTVLLVPNLHVKTHGGKPLTAWQIQILYDALISRMTLGKQTVVS